MEYLKSIKKLFLSAYGRLKEKVTNAYLILTGRHKIIGDVVIDTTTGEIIGQSNLGRIGTVIKNITVDILCGRIFYPKPSSTKGKVIRMLSVLGINTILAAGIIFIEGSKFSYLLLLKVIVLLYLISVMLELTKYVYSLAYVDRYYSSVEPLEGQVLSVTDDDVIVSEGTLAPEETPSPEETFDNEFFTSEAEESKFHLDLADFIKSKKLRPELAYYMFCYDKKAEHTRLDNEMKNFLNVSSNSIDVLKLIGRYPKLSSLIIPNGYFDDAYSKAFNRYLLPIMFEPNSSLTLARYTKYFYSLVKL